MIQHDKSAKKGKMNSEVIIKGYGLDQGKRWVSLSSVLGRPCLDYVISIKQHPLEMHRHLEGMLRYWAGNQGA